MAAKIPMLMPQMLTAKTRMVHPGLVKFIGGIVKGASVKGAVGGGHTLATRPDSRQTKIGVPVLILDGMDDPIYPVEMAKKMHPGRLGSQLAVIPGAAHAAIIEKPKASSRAILAWASGIK